MSTTDAPEHPRVDDEELLAAIERADSRALNGLPDKRTIAEECAYAPTTILGRVNHLAEAGRVATHRSVPVESGRTGVIVTVELLEDEDD